MIALVAAAALGGTEVDLGAYGALFVPSSQHELYDPSLPVHNTLSPAPVLGIRGDFRPIRFFGVEAEGDLGASGVSGAGAVLLAGWRGSLVGFVPVTDRVTPFLLAGAGYLAVASSADAVGSDNDGAFHAGVGSLIGIAPRLLLRAELRDYLTGHYQIVSTPAQHWEGLVGLTWIAKQPADPDPDHDGILGKADGCPDVPEVVNAWKDEDGCPDALATLEVDVVDPTGKPLPGATITVDGAEVGRTDPTGVLKVADRMPGTTVSKIAIGVNPKTGMDGAEIDESIALVEGVTTRQVQLQWLPGAVKVVTRSQQGAIVDATVAFRGPETRPDAPIGSDGEEVFVLAPGAWTLLVSAPQFGIERRELEIHPNQRSLVVIEVTLAPPIVETTKEEVVLLEAVQFDFDKATVKAESLPLLTQVANNLLAYDQVKKVEVQGHTDSKGSDRYNQKLSQARVDEVVKFLVGQGIDASRLVPVGYGEQCPIAPNTTDEGRTANRRVQFIVLDPAPTDGVPCHGTSPARRATPTTVQVTP